MNASAALSLKKLYEVSLHQLKDVLPESSADFRLEEAEFDQQKKEWNLVVSYRVPLPVNAVDALSSPLLGIRSNFERLYKTVRVTEKGDFLGFKIFRDK